MEVVQQKYDYNKALGWVGATNVVYYAENYVVALATQRLPWTAAGTAVGFGIGCAAGYFQGQDKLRDKVVADAKRMSQGNVDANCRTYAKVAGGFLVINNAFQYVVSLYSPEIGGAILGLVEGLTTGKMAGEAIGTRLRKNEQVQRDKKAK